jgi:hypothetical protein
MKPILRDLRTINKNDSVTGNRKQSEDHAKNDGVRQQPEPPRMCHCWKTSDRF